jgi:hypothetical protein
MKAIPSDEPDYDENGEIVVALTYPAGGYDVTLTTTIDSDTLDAILNQLAEAGA